MATQIHISQSVRSLICDTFGGNATDLLEGITKAGGEKFERVEELREVLFDMLAAGTEFFPLGSCDNFDVKKGCRGHEIEDAHR